MIPAELEHRILRLFLVERWKVGTIATQVGVHHGTVNRVLSEHGVPRAVRRRPSMVDPFMPFILETLEKYPRLPASRMYGMVVERGYPGGPDHFRSVVARVRPKKPAEAFLRLRTLSGEEGQVDWAHFGRVKIGRATRILSAFVMVLSWSRKDFVHFYLDQRLGSFLDGHVKAFEHVGGVPRRLLYDNLKSAVLERRQDAIRFHPTLLELAAHYRFEPRPVAVARGNEKGRVERMIRYLRTSFWPAREWADLDDLNQQVRDWSDTVAGTRKCPGNDPLTVREAWNEERGDLLELPPDRFPAHDRVEVKVRKQPYARFDRNDYTVPHDRVRRTLTVLATPSQIRIVDGDEVVAEHERSFDKGAQIEDPAHLAALREQKREARAQRGMDRLYHAVPATQELLAGAALRGHNLGSAVAGLLRLLDTWGADALRFGVDEALAADALHVAAVRQVLERRQQEAGEPPPLPVELPDDPRVRGLHVEPHSLSTYDELHEDGDDD